MALGGSICDAWHDAVSLGLIASGGVNRGILVQKFYEPEDAEERRRLTVMQLANEGRRGQTNRRSSNG